MFPAIKVIRFLVQLVTIGPSDGIMEAEEIVKMYPIHAM